MARGQHPGGVADRRVLDARSRRPKSFDLRREWEANKAARASPASTGRRSTAAAAARPTQKAIYDEEMARADAPRTVNTLGLTFLGADRHGDRHRRAEARDHRADAAQRGDLVPGLLRARRRIRPREPHHAGRGRRRRLRGQRPEDLDHQRAARRQDLRPGAHRPGVAAPPRHLDAADRHARSPASTPGRSSR